MDEHHASLAATVDAAVTVLGRAVRREVHRTLLSLVAGLISIAVLLVLALGFAVIGVMRLGDALVHACSGWFGDQVLGEVLAGIILLAVPLIGFLVLRWRIRRWS